MRIRGARDLHHAPEEALRIDLGYSSFALFAAIERLPTARGPSCSYLLQVRGPDVWARELLLEGCEPGVVELDFAPLDELPCARVVRAFLDREVDVADGDLVFELVV